MLQKDNHSDPVYENVLGAEVPDFLAEVTFETTRAIINLVYSGSLEKYSDIPMIFAHGGGTAPYIAWRIGLGSFVLPGGNERAPKGAVEYMKKLYYDTGLSANNYCFSSLKEMVSPSQILFGSDYPFAPEQITGITVKGVNEYRGFDGEEADKIRKDNALQLFPRFA